MAGAGSNRNTDRGAAEAQRDWGAAVEAAGHGVWDWDIAANRILLSARLNEILGGKRRDTHVDREQWLAPVHGDDRAALQSAIDEVLEGRSPMFQIQARLQAAGGEWKSGLVCGVVTGRDRRGGPRRMIGTITDLTAHRTALRQLAESEARGQAIIDAAMDAIITVDESQRIIQFNAAAEKIFGHSARGILGRPLEQLVPERVRQAHRQHVARFGTTGETMRRMGAASVLHGLRADGEEFPIDVSISRVEVGGRRFFTAILRDVTERERAAQQVEYSHRTLYAGMHEVREAERTRIARELHDELAQLLTALKMDVAWLKARLGPDRAPLAAKTDRMRELVDSMVSAVRRIAADLRPPLLDDLGLTAAVEHLLHEFSERAGVTVSLDLATDGIEFHDPLATAVYRMVQEALTNVARHAKASDVEVSMRVEGDRLRVRVRDNGRGFGPAEPDHKSFGVAGIRERARTLGGAAEIYGPAGGGVVVDISIPVAVGQGAGARV